MYKTTYTNAIVISRQTDNSWCLKIGHKIIKTIESNEIFNFYLYVI